jgi:hypothetical protein
MQRTTHFFIYSYIDLNTVCQVYAAPPGRDPTFFTYRRVGGGGEGEGWGGGLSPAAPSHIPSLDKAGLTQLIQYVHSLWFRLDTEHARGRYVRERIVMA